MLQLKANKDHWKAQLEAPPVLPNATAAHVKEDEKKEGAKDKAT